MIWNSRNEYLGSHVAKPWEIEHFLYLFLVLTYGWISLKSFFSKGPYSFCLLANLFVLTVILMGFVYILFHLSSIIFLYSKMCTWSVCLLTWPQKAMEFFVPSVFLVGSEDQFFFQRLLLGTSLVSFCQQPPNASESVSFYTVIFVCLFYIRHSIIFPHLPTYSSIITNAPCGCLQGNLMLEPLIALQFYFLSQLCIFAAVGLVTVTLAFWKLMNRHLKMNVQYLYIHFFFLNDGM